MILSAKSLEDVHTSNLIEEKRVDNIYSKNVVNRLLFSKQKQNSGLFVK